MRITARFARTALAALTTLATSAALTAPASAGLRINEPFGPVTGNLAERMADVPVDEYAYDRATRCVKREPAGSKALVRWLPQVSKLGSNWGTMRCELWGKNSASLHAEGRAVDWHLSVYNPAQKAEAEKLIRMLVAPDAEGNDFALARRLGVQGLIWDCRIWWGGPTLQRYSPCVSKAGTWKKKVNVTEAHRDHVHIELNKAGAKLQTSWWTVGPGRTLAARR